MAKTSLISPGYMGRSPRNNNSRTINYYPEKNSADSSSEYTLVGTQGCHLWTTVGGVVRGSHVFNGLTYIVVNNFLYYIDGLGNVSSVLGTLQTGAGPVEMTDNALFPTGGNQLIITDGTDNYYIYVVSNSVFIIVPVVVPATGASVLPTPLDLRQWSPIVWTGTTYIMVCDGYAALSPDGDSWTINTMPSDILCNAVAWNGSVYCAINTYPGENSAATSPDGVTWTVQSLPSIPPTVSQASIAAQGSTFCVVCGQSDVSNLCATSTDGITWTQRSSLPASRSWTFIMSNGSLFLALAQGNTNVAATSPDGVTWTQRTMPYSGNWVNAAWNGSVFCALATGSGAGYAATSPDGVTWTQRTMPLEYWYSSIAWTGSVFFAMEGLGHLNGAASSPDGITWTKRYLPDSSAWYTIASNGGGAVISNTTYYIADISSQSSFNGTNLLTNTLSPNYSIYSVCFINGYFVITLGGSQFLPLNLYDGSRYDLTNKFAASVSSDILLTVRNNHGELWLFCSTHTEIWDLTGASSPLFALASGGTVDYGLSSRYSVVVANNTVYALSTHKNNDQGEFFAVVAASGYGVVPVSSPAITYLISQIDVNYTIENAWGYSFTDGGHEFVRWTFPNDNGGNGSTYQFDTSTNLWSEVMTYPFNYANPGQHIGGSYFYFNGNHYLASYNSGSVYQMSSNFYDDFGNTITSNRIAPPLDDKAILNNTFISKLQVDVDTPPLNFTVVAAGTGTDVSGYLITPSIYWNGSFIGGIGNWVAIAYSGTVFCALSSQGIPSRSANGISWTEGSYLPGSITSWTSMAWGNGVFCAIANINAPGHQAAATSPDGITWTQRSLSSAIDWNNIIFNGSLFCVTGNSIGVLGPIIQTSPDGITWTNQTSGVGSSTIGNVGWNGSIFCTICSLGSRVSSSLTSPDGVNWTVHNNALPMVGNWIICGNGSIFCAIASGTSIVATSTDGINWMLGSMPVSANWVSITWGGTAFYAVASSTNTGAYSVDGITWNPQVLPTGNWNVVSSNYVPNSPPLSGTITLSVSKDCGYTWSAPMDSIFSVIDYISRYIWYRLGLSRQWQFNLTDTRMVKKILLAAYLDILGGTS